MAKAPAKTAKPKAPKASTTLYCSFCGKSQHEVAKLIAGPTVFICDECVELCTEVVDKAADDAVETPDGGHEFQMLLTFQPQLTELELENFPSFLRTVERAFPGTSIRLRKLYVHNGTATIGVLSPPSAKVKELREEIRGLTAKLRIAQQRVLGEEQARKALEDKVRDYETLIARRVVDDLKRSGEWPGYERRALLFCFVDVVGFSQFSDAAKSRTLDLLRHVAGMLVDAQEATLVNTWGDEVIACFEDPRLGLEAGCLFVRHLELHGLNVRVGVSWGMAAIRQNSLIGKEDVEGACVDLGARLQILAEPGEVLCSEDVRHLEGVDESIFAFLRTERAAIKAVAGIAAGEVIGVYSVTLRRNAGSILPTAAVPS